MSETFPFCSSSIIYNNLTNLRYSKITSPVDGTVISRAVDVGQTVAASFNTPTLFEVAKDLTKIVKLTKGFSGRDLKEKILKTALHNAIANDCDIITMENIDYALKICKIKNKIDFFI